jgi:hypothetical protein
MTNSGLWYLCQGAGGMKDGLNTKLFQVRYYKHVLHLCVFGMIVRHLKLGTNWDLVRTLHANIEHGLLIYVTANCVGSTCSSDPCSMRLRDGFLYYHGLIIFLHLTYC